jgi:RNA polymerase sigma factor (TIGR02999 family)
MPISNETSTGEIPRDVTRLLVAWSGGDEAALDQLYPLVYEELHRLAYGRMRHERQGHTLQPTALVHEAFLRLADQNRGIWENRGHFFAIATRMMRRVLVDYARRRQRGKRGGGAVHLSLEEALEAGRPPARDVLAVHDAIEVLATVDRRKARMVELRFFGGLSIEETAECLGVSPGTVMRDWTLSKAWLKRQIQTPIATSGTH